MRPRACLYQGVSGPDVAVTPKTLPFVDGIREEVRQRSSPIAATPPMTRSTTSPTPSSGRVRPTRTSSSTHSSRPMGRNHRPGPVRGQGQLAPPHALKIGNGRHHTGLMLQWQDGKQINMWPADVANGKMKFPSFVKLSHVQLIRQDPPSLEIESGGILYDRMTSLLLRAPLMPGIRANPDRWFRDQLALCAGRHGVHADLRRVGRAESVARSATWCRASVSGMGCSTARVSV